MANPPVLIIQPRRLGDLILTFPLVQSLQRRFPKSPVLFAGEELFYKDLQPLAPAVQFFPKSSLEILSRGEYKLVINLDSSPQSAACAAKARADLKLGPVLTKSGAPRVEGFWQLYRASLTQNNRHNLFHWADLNRLDLEWPLLPPAPAMPIKQKASMIGLFIGASEPAKRPGTDFWTELVRLLLARGFKPLLLGGPSEKAEGEAIAAKAGIRSANFCGKTSLAQLAALLQSLDLLITPDTGPMHLADWLGMPVLNLSMGNVSAAETGPSRPGQLALRAAMSCAGCWRCGRSRLYCRNALPPPLVLRAAQAALSGELSKLSLPGCVPLISGRDKNGLFALSPLSRAPSAAEALNLFWKDAFLAFNNKIPLESARKKALLIAESRPALSENIRKNIKKLLSFLLLSVKGRPPENIWKNFPRHLSLFAGFVEMSLQNESFSREALSHAIELTRQTGDLFAP